MRPPCIMKWDAALESYVPVTDAVEASNIAKRCFYRSSEHAALSLEGRATVLLGQLTACDTNDERRDVLAQALLAESATPVHQDLSGVEPVDNEALKRWAKERGR